MTLKLCSSHETSCTHFTSTIRCLILTTYLNIKERSNNFRHLKLKTWESSIWAFNLKFEKYSGSPIYNSFINNKVSDGSKEWRSNINFSMKSRNSLDFGYWIFFLRKFKLWMLQITLQKQQRLVLDRKQWGLIYFLLIFHI